MGREIEKEAVVRGHEVISVFDPAEDMPFDHDKLLEADLAIEYSIPDSVINNILTCFKASKPIVVGTTGWYEHLPEINKTCLSCGGTLFFAPNFSLTVNIFFRLNKYLAGLMNHQKGYEVLISEVHHTKKKDAPSGTAERLAIGLVDNLDDKNNWITFGKGALVGLTPGEIPIMYSREDDVVGIHEVEYQSDADKISIRHEAHNRKGFAIGTLVASEWVLSKKGVFGMEDLLKDTLK